jgi:uncharacterized membrane-anchored protein YhcB (DUF1043 family)
MDDMKKRIIMVCWLFFIITGTLLFLINLVMTEYNIPDPPNYVTIVIEIVIGFFIAVLVYMITRKQQSDTEKREETRKTEEHQHYKERLFSELDRLVGLLSSVVDQYGDIRQKNAMIKNNSHAERSWVKLSSVNTMFNAPSHIRRNLDDLLSYLDAIIEGVNHGCLMIRDSKNFNSELAKQVKEFLDNDFFKKNNNEVIDKKSNELNNTLSQMISSIDNSQKE